MRFKEGDEPGVSNGRINRRRARATRSENNKIYILICARTSSRPTSKESRREIGGGGERNEERERVGRGERAGSGRLSHYEGTSNTEGSKSSRKTNACLLYTNLYNESL